MPGPPGRCKCIFIFSVRSGRKRRPPRGRPDGVVGPKSPYVMTSADKIWRVRRCRVIFTFLFSSSRKTVIQPFVWPKIVSRKRRVGVQFVVRFASDVVNRTLWGLLKQSAELSLDETWFSRVPVAENTESCSVTFYIALYSSGWFAPSKLFVRLKSTPLFAFFFCYLLLEIRSKLIEIFCVGRSAKVIKIF